MRPIWNGMLSFGLVNIPVGLYPATEDADLHFHLLHKEDGGRIRNQRVCDVDGKPVEYSDLVKGYEYEKGSFVEISDEDLEKVRVEASDRIVIDDFVNGAEIDPTFFEKPYFLLPGKKSDAPYALLREAMKNTGKVGIARIVIRTRERLAAIRVDGASIMLDTMHFADELRSVEGAPAESISVGKRELDMAIMLINAMSTKFEPSKYHDTYKEAVLELIHEKLDGKEVVHQEEHVEPTQIIDLMAFLKSSIEKTGKSSVAEDASQQKTEDEKASPARRPRQRKSKEAAG
jgi:DNA end-binding protein Ku